MVQARGDQRCKGYHIPRGRQFRPGHAGAARALYAVLVPGGFLVVTSPPLPLLLSSPLTPWSRQSLRDKGWIDALKAYIQADRPFFGICLGMQSLFEGSEETPGTAAPSILCKASVRLILTD